MDSFSIIGLDDDPVQTLPDSIKIMHKRFDLRERTGKETITDGRLAEINFLEAEISYLKLEGSEVVDSLIHEILHGIFKMTNLRNGMNEEDEEHIVTVLATGLTTVMADNHGLFPALQELLNDA